MEEIRPSIGECELPTGFFINDAIVKKISFRELAGPEEDILASNKSATDKLTEVMANCTMSIGDLALNPIEIRKMIESMTITDRWFYLIQLRCLSLGETYEFSTACPACDTVDKVIYNLKEVLVKNPPSANNLFKEVTLSTGRKVRIRAADGHADKVIERSTTDNAPTIALFARCTEINGQPSSIADIKKMTMRERAELRSHIDALEGDFDDKYKAKCPKCQHEYEGELQLEGESFFTP